MKCLNNFDQQNLKNQTLKNQTLINQIFNLSAYNFKIAEIFKKIIILAQEKNINPQLVQDHNLFRPSEILAKKYTLNCEKACTLLNWKPQYTFEEALKNTFESYFKK